MHQPVELAVVIIGVIAMVMNVVGLVKALLANKKFLSGTYKRVVELVLLLVVFLNVHILMEVINNGIMYYEEVPSNYTLTHISFVFVILISLAAIAASLVNMQMAKEYGFR